MAWAARRPCNLDRPLASVLERVLERVLAQAPELVPEREQELVRRVPGS